MPQAEKALSRVCDHCGLSLAPGQKQFCCAGCETVYSVLHQLGLNKYYLIRKNAGEAGVRANVENLNYAYMDHPAFQSKVVKTLADGSFEASLALSGVHCSACVWVVERLPQFQEGVIEARLDFGKAEAQLRWDPTQTCLSEIARGLSRLGYAPRLVQDQASQAHALEEEREGRKQLLRIGVAGFCAGNLMMVGVSVWEGALSGIAPKFLSFFVKTSAVLVLPAVTYSAWPFYRRAWQGLRAGVIHMDLPISLAIIGAFGVSLLRALQGRDAIYFDSLASLVFLLLVGRWMQWSALRRVRHTLRMSMTGMPEHAVLESGEAVPIEALRRGNRVRVAAGARVPVDGHVVSGLSAVDRAILTGETQPLPVRPGDRVLAGSLNQSAELIVQTDSTGTDTEVGQLEALVQRATQSQSPLTLWMDRLARYFVVGVFVLALLTLAIWVPRAGWDIAIDHVLALLIVSCPCALGLGTPLALSFSIGAGARSGILIRGIEVLEKLRAIRQIAWDKTGTLTHGTLRISEISWSPEGALHQEEALGVCLALEQGVQHPIALSLATELRARGITPTRLESEVTLVPGSGVSSGVWALGSPSWVGWKSDSSGTQVVLTRDQKMWCVISLGDVLRPETPAVVEKLRRRKLKMSILSGDRAEPVKSLAGQLGLSFQCELSPGAKLQAIQNLRAKSGPLLMVGDGVNDAAALAAADVGVSIMSEGASLSVQAAPVVLLRKDLALVPKAFELADGTWRTIQRNLGFSLFYNLAGATAAVCGVVRPLTAAILMPLSSLTIIAVSLLSNPFRKKS